MKAFSPAYPIAYAAPNSDERNDVVFFGDSTCRSFGIDPLEFQRITGLKAFQLGEQWQKLGGNGMAVTVMAYLTSCIPSHAICDVCVSPFML